MIFSDFENLEFLDLGEFFVIFEKPGFSVKKFPQIQIFKIT